MKKLLSTLLLVVWTVAFAQAAQVQQQAPKRGRDKDEQKEEDKQEQRTHKPKVPLLVVGALQMLYKVVKKK